MCQSIHPSCVASVFNQPADMLFCPSGLFHLSIIYLRWSCCSGYVISCTLPWTLKPPLRSDPSWRHIKLKREISVSVHHPFTLQQNTDTSHRRHKQGSERETQKDRTKRKERKGEKNKERGDEMLQLLSGEKRGEAGLTIRANVSLLVLAGSSQEVRQGSGLLQTNRETRDRVQGSVPGEDLKEKPWNVWN